MFLSPTGNSNVVPGQTVAVAARIAIVALLLLTGCTSTVRHDHGAVSKVPQHAVDEYDPDPVHETPVLDLAAAPDLEGIIPRLADKRVVLVGERHNRFDHHLTQLEIIRRLHALHPRLAIGMEAFQQPFQGVLDDYIAGNLSERELLRATEYYQRWKFDFRHYAPILRYAREHQLPVVALNLPAELTRKVGRNGRDALTAEEQAQLPDEIDRSDTDYEKRLRKIFNQHPHDSTRSFDNFLEVQLLWDEGMAEQAADYLIAHPDYTMVILAGSGHVARGSGIPRRLTRRLQADSAIVLNGWDGTLAPDLADFILLTEPRKLPPAGTFGVLLDDTAAVPTVSTCLSDSPCKSAGLRRGDRFLSIDGEPINDMLDLRLVMWDKQPGDTVNLEISRTRWFSQPQELSFTIELQ
jgi:uncharacterized iron-regulated protein